MASSTANVAFGYLSVLLANFCGDERTRCLVADGLGKGGLTVLVEGLEEFVRLHQRVDVLGALGEDAALDVGGGAGEIDGMATGDGREVWSAFTERLVEVLGRLREVTGVV